MIPALLCVTSEQTRRNQAVLLYCNRRYCLAIRLSRLFGSGFFSISATAVATVLPNVLRFINALCRELTFAKEKRRQFRRAQRACLFDDDFRFVREFNVGVFDDLRSRLFDYGIACNFAIRNGIRNTYAKRCLGTFFLRVVRAFYASDLGFQGGGVQLIFTCCAFRDVSVRRTRCLAFVYRLRNEHSNVQITDGSVLTLALNEGGGLLTRLAKAWRWGLFRRFFCLRFCVFAV